ncbi:flagellar biosynthetic protein FliO [Defluviitalea phaphyphila]|uniref:flagellar biosynthetic protein FliO n=1 Tax=Defluviitalea phaphyphila TaxID=1473580 RepID=UPI00073155D4|nr:flagellar biosynthetic protein FliO [Defluviitalea phaphyphila]
MININDFLNFAFGQITFLDSEMQINTNWFKMLGQFFFLIIIFILILILTYYVTKWIGKFQYKKYQGNNIKIIESITIAPQKTLQLIKVGNKIHLIGLSKDNITYLTEIDEDIIKNPILENHVNNVSDNKFEFYLKSWVQKLKKDSKIKDTTSTGEIHDENK